MERTAESGEAVLVFVCIGQLVQTCLLTLVASTFMINSNRSTVPPSFLSKDVRNFGRDFSDGVMLAEIIAHFLPRYVALNTFAHVHSVALKKFNWESLQKVVLRHLGIQLGVEQIDRLANGEPGVIEPVLVHLRERIEDAVENRRFRPSGSAQRSRSSSRGGSHLHLNRLDEKSEDGNSSEIQSHKHCQNGFSSTARIKQQNNHHTNPANSTYNHASSTDQNNCTGQKTAQLFEDLTKDQLIERLYAKIRWQEGQLAKKDDQIELLTRKVDGLLEIACSIKNESSRSRHPPAPSRAPTLASNDIYDSSEHLCFNKAHGAMDSPTTNDYGI